MRLLTRIDDWIFNSYRISGEALGVYRIIFASFFLLVQGPPRISWISRYPDAFFQPPLSVARLFSGFPDPVVLTLIDLSLAALLLALLFGFHTRTASVCITGMAMLSFSFSFSFGKINHTTLPWLIPFFMAFANWGACYSVDAARRSPATPSVSTWPVALLSIVFGFAMFTGGWAKLTGGWLSLETQGARHQVVRHWFTLDTPAPLAESLIQNVNVVFWECLDWLTVGFELGFLVAVLWPPVFRAFTAGAIAFHLTVLLALAIDTFGDHLVLYLLFAMPALQINPPCVDRMLASVGRPGLLLLPFLLAAWYFSFGASPFYTVLGWMNVSAAQAQAALWILGLLLATYLLLRPRRSEMPS